MKRQKILVIGGPTAVGKSDFAVSIAQEINGEIVNADSVQIYKDLNIGTAKPPQESIKKVTHHLLDVADPSEPWDAKRYEIEALKVIEEITQRGKIPIIVGGSGFYIEALLSGLEENISKDTKLREELWRMDNLTLYNKLKEVDPERAAKIHPNDKKRIIRALEIFILTGTKPSTIKWKPQTRKHWDVLKVAIVREKEELKKRIESRTAKMIEEGWLDETERLLNKYGKIRILTSTIGYREMIKVIEGEITQEEALQIIIKKTYKYAKRQISWFKAYQYNFFIFNKEEATLKKTIEKWLHDKDNWW